jgi:transcriptional regulator with XRE-family HTH domain
MSTKSHLLKIVSSLRDRARRTLFVETQIETLIPFQIRAMRTRLGWTQKDLAKQSGMAQGRISLLENTSYEGAVNVKTLLKIAAAFDVGLVVRFAPFGEIAEWSARLSKENHEVPSFDMEFAALQKAVESEANEFPIQRRLSTMAAGPFNSFSVKGQRNVPAA